VDKHIVMDFTCIVRTVYVYRKGRLYSLSLWMPTQYIAWPTEYSLADSGTTFRSQTGKPIN